MPSFSKRTPSSKVGRKILSMDPDFFECVYDILEEPKVLALEECRHHRTTNRLEHCLNVAYRSYRLAKLRGYDARSTARGGLLHDFYWYDEDEMNPIERKFHLTNHPKVALKNALEIFDLNSIEQDIIVKHMFMITPTPPRYKESMIVTMMDKYCAAQEAMGFSPGENEISRTMVARLAIANRF